MHTQKHCKDNVPFNLAKRVIIFVSNDEKVEMRLNESKNWLKIVITQTVSLISRFVMQNYTIYHPLHIIRKIFL